MTLEQAQSAFTVAEFNEWYKNLEDKGRWGSNNPEFKLPEDNISPWGEIEYGIDEGRDRDHPSSYYLIIKIDDRFFQTTGYYDSQEGVDWDSNGWIEVVKKTKTEEYWGEI